MWNQGDGSTVLCFIGIGGRHTWFTQNEEKYKKDPSLEKSLC
ncbi:hypothetical protein [Salipaludibacillus neizhouensis]|nr:hypothetical protein [Salipaludibacillus neizhouensis]